MWTFESGLAFVRDLEKLLSSNNNHEWQRWHAALAGGVLHSRQSAHDLDVVVIPRDTSRASYVPIWQSMIQLGFTRYDTWQDKRARWRDAGLGDCKKVESWRDGEGRRVDLILAEFDDTEPALAGDPR